MCSTTRFASRLALCLAITVVVSIAWPVSTAAGAFRVSEVLFTKEFINDPVLPGGVVTLEFMLANLSDTYAVADLSFSDDLSATLAGLEALTGPLYDIVGRGSQLAGTDFLTLTGGSLAPGATATFQIRLQVPLTAAPGFYTNTTSDLFVLGEPTALPASDTLEVIPEPATMLLLLAGLGPMVLRRRK